MFRWTSFPTLRAILPSVIYRSQRLPRIAQHSLRTCMAFMNWILHEVLRGTAVDSYAVLTRLKLQ